MSKGINNRVFTNKQAALMARARADAYKLNILDRLFSSSFSPTVDKVENSNYEYAALERTAILLEELAEFKPNAPCKVEQ